MRYNLPPIPGIQPASNDSLRKLYHIQILTSSAHTCRNTCTYPYNLFPTFYTSCLFCILLLFISIYYSEFLLSWYLRTSKLFIQNISLLVYIMAYLLSTFDGYLDYFHWFVIINNVVMNNLEHTYCIILVSILQTSSQYVFGADILVEI